MGDQITNKNCIVIIPAYRAFTPIELRFLENGLSKTKGFKQVLVAPHHLVIDSSFGQLQRLKVERFSDHYFSNIQGYNQLMLAIEFYTRFTDTEYILIHQSDVYLFKNELDYWCLKGFDYIGAPWYRHSKLNKGKLVSWIYQKIWQPFLSRKRKNGWLYNKVGNGGLSLRKVQSALDVINNCDEQLLNIYRTSSSPHYNEDVFWSIEAPRLNNRFLIPSWKEALKFAVELEPSFAIFQLGNELPFGCHAPLLTDPGFWEEYIPEINQEYVLPKPQ